MVRSSWWSCVLALMVACVGEPEHGTWSGPTEGSGSGGTCGNDAVEEGEGCDDGNTLDGDGCSSTCQPESASCGDGIVQGWAGEQCDDGNTSGNDGCSASCDVESASCGDWIVQGWAGEQCDDGNAFSGDGCSSTCQQEMASCGDWIVQGWAGEQCDDGNAYGGDGCDAWCQQEYATCGDWIVQGWAGEQCDDGNASGNDGCDAWCQQEYASCGDWIVQGWAGEQCDDGNTSGNDGCDASCQQEYASCGDWIVQGWAGEQCDDGNAYGGDGCDEWCQIEPPSCAPAEEWCSDGVDDDCDGNTDCADSDCPCACSCEAGATIDSEAGGECSSCFGGTCQPFEEPPPEVPDSEEIPGPGDEDLYGAFATAAGGCAPIDACIEKVNKMCYANDFTCLAFGFAVQMCLWYNTDPRINAQQQTVYYKRGTEEIGHMMLIFPHPDGAGTPENPHAFCFSDVYTGGGCAGNDNLCCWRQSTATPRPPDFCKAKVAQMRKKNGVAPTDVRFSGSAFWGTRYTPFTADAAVRKRFEGCSGLDTKSWPQTIGTY